MTTIHLQAIIQEDRSCSGRGQAPVHRKQVMLLLTLWQAVETAGSRLLTINALQVGNPAEEDLKNWGHHTSTATVPDPIMQRMAADPVTFVFSCEVSKMSLPGVWKVEGVCPSQD